jgi:serpin B
LNNRLKPARRGLLAAICIAGVSASADTQADRDDLTTANTAFAFDLLKQIASKQGDRNIFISPYSVSAVLQMVSDGAAAGTKQEIESVLHVGQLSAPDADYQSLLQSMIREQSGVTLDLSNSIWYKQGVTLKPQFSVRISKFFHAKTDALDFGSPQSAVTINNWALNATHGRIKDIVQWPMDPLTRLILANAIYFKGRWANEFDKSATKDRAFTLANGTQRQVTMMKQLGHFDYFQAQDFKAASLPYVGGRLQIYLLLPSAGSEVNKLLAAFDGNTWQHDILPHLSDRKGRIVLPRFKLNYNIVLNESLEALAMKRAFSPGCLRRDLQAFHFENVGTLFFEKRALTGFPTRHLSIPSVTA